MRILVVGSRGFRLHRGVGRGLHLHLWRLVIYVSAAAQERDRQAAHRLAAEGDWWA